MLDKSGTHRAMEPCIRRLALSGCRKRPASGWPVQLFMASRNEPMRFNFEGVYREIDFGKSIAYTIADRREVTIGFYPAGTETRVVETFEAESAHSLPGTAAR